MHKLTKLDLPLICHLAMVDHRIGFDEYRAALWAHQEKRRVEAAAQTTPLQNAPPSDAPRRAK